MLFMVFMVFIKSIFFFELALTEPFCGLAKAKLAARDSRPTKTGGGGNRTRVP